MEPELPEFSTISINTLSQNSLYQHILAYLDQRTVNALTLTIKNLTEPTKNIMLDSLYWKERLELLLGRILPDDNSINWKTVHDYLSRYQTKPEWFRIIGIIGDYKIFSILYDTYRKILSNDVMNKLAAITFNNAGHVFENFCCPWLL